MSGVIDIWLVLKILLLAWLWIGSFWVYFHWLFKKERNVLPPERPDV